MSDTLFKCKNCSDITDTDEKRSITISNYTTKSSARASICSKCFIEFVNNLPFKIEWKEWPKRD